MMVPLARPRHHGKARAELALEKIRLLYEVEREADDKQMSYEERRQLRMDISVLILMGFEAWLQAEAPKVLPKSPIGKAIDPLLPGALRPALPLCRGRPLLDRQQPG